MLLYRLNLANIKTTVSVFEDIKLRWGEARNRFVYW
jgi:hypothetical protein